RACRNLIIATRNNSARVKIDDVCRSLLEADLSAKFHAVETAASDLPIVEVVTFLDLLSTLKNDPLPPNLTLADELIKPLPITVNGTTPGEAAGAYASLNRLRCEVGIYLYYVALIVAFFSEPPLAEEKFAAAIANGTFDAVARLRQSFALKPEFGSAIAH